MSIFFQQGVGEAESTFAIQCVVMMWHWTWIQRLDENGGSEPEDDLDEP